MTVLWPVRGEVPIEPPDGGTGINNVSIVLLGRDRAVPVPARRRRRGGHRPALLAAGLPRLDLLKVAHHGSRTATTQAFVDAVRPRIAIASAGAGNPYGHPTRQTLERLASRGRGRLPHGPGRDGPSTFTAGGHRVRAEGAAASRRPWPDRRRAAADRGPHAIPRRRPSPFAAPSRRPRSCPSASRRRPRPADAADRPTAARPGSAATVGYHRVDDGPPARGGRLPPALPRSPGLVRAARARRRGGRRLAGGADRGRGIAVDRRLVEAAALLHDVDKVLPADDPARALPPRRGLGGLAHPARATRSWHAPSPATRSPGSSTARPPALGGFATREERIVAYADKRAGQRLESMDARFASWRRRYPEDPRRPIDRLGRRGRGIASAARRASRGGCLPGRRRRPADVRRLPGPATPCAAARLARMTVSPLAYVLGRRRAVGRPGGRSRSPRRLARGDRRRRWSAGICAATRAGRDPGRADSTSAWPRR